MLCRAEREGRFWIQLVCGVRLRALALAGTELDGIYRNAEYFIFGLGGVGPLLLEDYCSSELDWWIALISCLRYFFSRPFYLA